MQVVAMVLRGILQQIPTVLTYLVLGALLYWGVVLHWKNPWAEEKEAAAPTKVEVDLANQVAEVVALPGQPLRIRFRDQRRLEQSELATPSATQPVQTRNLAQLVQANGVLDYDRTQYAEMSPRADGVVWRVLSREGDRVKSGQVLAVVASAEVGKAKSDFLAAYFTEQARRTDLDRLQAASSAVPERVIREAKTEARVARVNLLQAEQTLLNFGLPVRRNDLAGLNEEEALRRLRLLGLPEEIRKTVNPDTLTADLLPITAPFDGEVVSRDMVVGEVVEKGKPLLIVADLDELWVNLNIRAEDAGRLALGQEVRIQPERPNTPSTIARLIRINPAMDPKTRTVRARAALTNPKGTLRPETFVSAAVVVREIPDAVAVPTEAIVYDQGKPLVFVQSATDPLEFEACVLTLGIQDNGSTQVTAGLKAGDRVVVASTHVLKSELVKHRMNSQD
jgi:cobalt-zinc-cadmium efflux system membrane fusion protein